MSVEDGIPETGQAPEPPQHDWEKDYKELQATYTQSQQRLKELERYESDPQAFIELGKQRGWVEIEEAQQQQQADDPYADRGSASKPPSQGSRSTTRESRPRTPRPARNSSTPTSTRGRSRRA
jgi:hypothetical protein